MSAMTNFEHFRNFCITTEHFSCHLFFHDNSFETVINDLERLNRVKEDDIVYFEGAWGIRENSFNDTVSFKVISTLSKVDRYGIGDWHGHDCYSNFRLFGLDMMYHLIDIGIGRDVIQPLLTRLYEEYSAHEKASGDDDYQEFVELWNDYYMEGKGEDDFYEINKRICEHNHARHN